MTRIYTTAKKIYLDQNAISSLVRDPAWGDLSAKLQFGASQGLLCCPLPFDTISESSQCQEGTRTRIFQLFAHISCGLMWKGYWDILCDEIYVLIRGGHHPNGLAFAPDMRALCRYSGSIAAEYGTLKNERTAEIQAFTMPSSLLELSKDEIFQSVRLEVLGKLYTDLERYFQEFPHLSDEPFKSRRIMDFLIEVKLTKEEATSLAEKLRYHEIEKIPVFIYHCFLTSQSAFTRSRDPRRIFNYNDIVDQERLSVAMAYSNYAVTDRAMHQRITDSGVATYTTNTTFPLSQMGSLEEIVNEILEVVRKVRSGIRHAQ